MLRSKSCNPGALLAAAAALGLAACGSALERGADGAASGAAPAAIVEVAYTCADGRRIEARYDNTRPGQSGARLQLDGRSFELYNVVAASGARYATESGLRPDHGLQWWTKGDEATLSEMLMDHTAPGPVLLTTCTAVRDP
ncbi:MAG TPA: MliC family protein [Pseudomonadota bacterium]|nr:MliC family protein [Xanthomonadales bacterium]MBP7418465.1 MliC family protein [Xanthomonadales bacterium]HQW64363.1 MliC family protein [Pseudomonadota bacterium]HQY36286.1 MliC family protein [Pseudomonadota bacterium]HRA37137.1 MliC family protein [Pseudomonadota bacterium]